MGAKGGGYVTSEEMALRLEGVAKIYGRTPALRAFSCQVPAGTTLALLGQNGSGKTTLLKIVAGATAPTLGRVNIFGQDSTRDLSDRGLVGMLAAESYLYDDLTARENLRFAVTMAGRRASEGDVRAALTETGLKAQSGERARSFSSGMKRRLGIARLLLLRPRLLLLDEPYNSLDSEGAEVVDALVRRTVQEGGAVVLASHDRERALSLADTVAVLENGRTLYLGSRTGYRTGHAQYVG